MIKSDKIFVEKIVTPLVKVKIYLEEDHYIAEINGHMQLGHACFDLQACRDMIDAWINKPISVRGIVVISNEQLNALK